MGACLFNPGDILKEYNQISNQIVIIFSGEVGIYAKIANDNEVLLEKYKNKDIIGENTLNMKVTKSCKAVAISKVQAFFFNKSVG